MKPRHRDQEWSVPLHAAPWQRRQRPQNRRDNHSAYRESRRDGFPGTSVVTSESERERAGTTGTSANGVRLVMTRARLVQCLALRVRARSRSLFIIPLVFELLFSGIFLAVHPVYAVFKNFPLIFPLFFHFA